MLWLHQDYSISIVITEKLAQQFAGLFKILQQIERLAYKLKLLSHWSVHPVISIAHLKFSKNDIFNWFWSDHPDSVYVEDDMNQWKSFIIEKLIDKCVWIECKRSITEYLVHWLDYKPEYNMWYRVENLQNAQALIDDYEKLHGNSLSVNNAPKKPCSRPQKNSISAEQLINRPAKHCRRSFKKAVDTIAKLAEIFNKKTSWIQSFHHVQ